MGLLVGGPRSFIFVIVFIYINHRPLSLLLVIQKGSVGLVGQIQSLVLKGNFMFLVTNLLIILVILAQSSLFLFASGSEFYACHLFHGTHQLVWIVHLCVQEGLWILGTSFLLLFTLLLILLLVLTWRWISHQDRLVDN